MHKFITFTTAVLVLLFTLFLGLSSDKGEATTIAMIGMATVFLTILLGLYFEDISEKLGELIELKKNENQRKENSETPKIEYGKFH